MRKYLSFGGGVNSVAMQILMINEGIEFESIFVDHGADYPETYEYFNIFHEWLKTNGHKPIKRIKAVVSRKGIKYNSLIDYCEERNIIPQQWPRWCTADWKRDQVSKNIEKPCFMMIGIDTGESKRAKISSSGKIEYRYPLIEYEIDREGCKQVIKKAGLPVPKKSGCFICPFQGRSQWINLRRKHPCLFEKAVKLEKASGRTFHRKMNLKAYVNENQMSLFNDDYPPCECML